MSGEDEKRYSKIPGYFLIQNNNFTKYRFFPLEIGEIRFNWG